MRRVFVDTLYWIAVTNAKDQWHQAAMQVSRQIEGCRLITTDDVLTEVLAAYCESGSHFRRRAVVLVRGLHSDPEWSRD